MTETVKLKRGDTVSVLGGWSAGTSASMEYHGISIEKL